MKLWFSALCALFVALVKCGNENIVVAAILEDENTIQEQHKEHMQHRQASRRHLRGLKGKNKGSNNNFAVAGGGGGVKGGKKKTDKSSFDGGNQATDRFDNKNYFTTNPANANEFNGFTSFANPKSGKSGWGPSPYQLDSVGPYGVAETKPCVSPDTITNNQLINPSSAVDCGSLNYPFSSGCCRSYWWLILDESGTAFPSVPCICNRFTRPPESFNFKATPSITLKPQTPNPTPPPTHFGNVNIVDPTIPPTPEAPPGDSTPPPTEPTSPPTPPPSDGTVVLVDRTEDANANAIVPVDPITAPNAGRCDYAAGDGTKCTTSSRCESLVAGIESDMRVRVCCVAEFCACGFYRNRAQCVP